jgi:hypothetical protein
MRAGSDVNDMLAQRDGFGDRVHGVGLAQLNIGWNNPVIPGGAQRRPGIHSGALPVEVQAWIPGLPSVARDDAEGEVRA